MPAQPKFALRMKDIVLACLKTYGPQAVRQLCMRTGLQRGQVGGAITQLKAAHQIYVATKLDEGHHSVYVYQAVGCHNPLDLPEQINRFSESKDRRTTHHIKLDSPLIIPKRPMPPMAWLAMQPLPQMSAR